MKFTQKLITILVTGLLVASCATNSDVQSVEQLVLDGQKSVARLDQKVVQLEADKAQLSQQLDAVDSNVSKAIEIKDKIAAIDASIATYKSEITKVNAQIAKNSTGLSVVREQQEAQREATALALKENEELKVRAIEEIEALEREYAKKRKAAKEDNKEQ